MSSMVYLSVIKLTVGYVLGFVTCCVQFFGAGMAEHCDMNRERNVRAVC